MDEEKGGHIGNSTGADQSGVHKLKNPPKHKEAGYSIKDYFNLEQSKGKMTGRGGGGGRSGKTPQKAPKNAQGGGGGVKTPLKPSPVGEASKTIPDKNNDNENGAKGKTGDTEWSFESLAKLINDFETNMNTRIDGVRTEVQDIKGTFDTWKDATEIRLTKLEEDYTQTAEDMVKHNRMASQIDTASVTINTEMADMRERYDRIEEQLKATQAVLKVVYKENNLYGRAIKSYNIRIGKLGEPIVPDKRGVNTAQKPREDTKAIVAKFIHDKKLHPNKSLLEITACIDVAYRTGTVESNKVRNVLVKFCTITDRNIIMVNGKIAEREKRLDGSYLMDDNTPEDMSQKKRCNVYMKNLKDTDKRPSFKHGRLRTMDGFVKEQQIKAYNKKHKIEDSRKHDITIDLLTMHLPRKKRNRAQEIEEGSEDKEGDKAEPIVIEEPPTEGDEEHIGANQAQAQEVAEDEIQPEQEEKREAITTEKAGDEAKEDQD